MPDASPVKWHLAHTSWFFETFLLDAALPGYRSYDPAFRILFNSYYNAVGDKHPRPQRGLISRPSRRDVVAYRAHVDEAMQRLLARPDAGDTELARSDRARSATRAAASGTDPDRRAAPAVVQPAAARLPPARRRRLAAPRATRRRRPGSSSTADWPRSDTTATVSPSTTKCPATASFWRRSRWRADRSRNGDYLAFIGDGGYRRPELWLSEGWDWLNAGANRLAALLAARRRRLAPVHLARHAADRRCRARVPRQPVRSRCLRALGGRAIADRIGMGGGRRARSGRRLVSSKTARCCRARRPPLAAR